MYVKKLKDHQIADIMRVISDPDAEVTDIRRPYTDPEVTVLSQDMEEHYVLHDLDIEGFDFLLMMRQSSIGRKCWNFSAWITH